MRQALLLAALLGATPAVVSSPEAWEEFRADVRKACEKAVSGSLRKPTIQVDPFGSESFGIAIAKGQSKYSKDRLAIVCVYNKRTKAVETSGELAP